jgi:hypothetical protein
MSCSCYAIETNVSRLQRFTWLGRWLAWDLLAWRLGWPLGLQAWSRLVRQLAWSQRGHQRAWSRLALHLGQPGLCSASWPCRVGLLFLSRRNQRAQHLSPKRGPPTIASQTSSNPPETRLPQNRRFQVSSQEPLIPEQTASCITVFCKPFENLLSRLLCVRSRSRQLVDAIFLGVGESSGGVPRRAHYITGS